MSVMPFNVRTMSTYDAFAAAWTGAMGILSGAHGKSVYEMCRDGLDTTMARRIRKLATIYYGPTRSPRKQADSRAFADESGHTLNTLAAIVRYVGELKDKSHAWQVRQTLAQERAVLSTLHEAGKELVAKLNGPEPLTNEPAVRTRAIKNSTFTRLIIDAPSHLVKQAVDALHAEKSAVHPALRAVNLLAGGGSGQAPPIIPMVIIGIDDLDKVMDNQCDDVLLSVSNGTVMRGSDFARATFADHGYSVIVDPLEGVLDVQTITRFGNFKQRLAATAESPVCNGPGCAVGADRSALHHIVPYSRGGPTTIKNLAILCDYHNGRNDDDRTRPLHGHIERINGQIYHVPPSGGRPRQNQHPAAQGGAMRLVNR